MGAAPTRTHSHAAPPGLTTMAKVKTSPPRVDKPLPEVKRKLRPDRPGWQVPVTSDPMYPFRNAPPVSLADDPRVKALAMLLVHPQTPHELKRISWGALKMLYLQNQPQGQDQDE